MYRQIIIFIINHLSLSIIIWLSILNVLPLQYHQQQYIDCFEQPMITDNGNGNGKQTLSTTKSIQSKSNPSSSFITLKRSIRSTTSFFDNSSPSFSSSSSSPSKSSSSSLWNVFHWFRPSDRMSVTFLPVTGNNDDNDSFNGRHSRYNSNNIGRRRRFLFNGNHFIPSRGKKSRSPLIIKNSDQIPYVNYNDDNEELVDKFIENKNNNNNNNNNDETDYGNESMESIQTVKEPSKQTMTMATDWINRSITKSLSSTATKTKSNKMMIIWAFLLPLDNDDDNVKHY
ncbi:uncharacterized protein LOC124497278 [Dermatophagoides farinae]|uniref:Uncharacterized protein n=1 Tax=Dermatophagoides farinae TaxID=6954 RepID=A0A922HR49_DERFA|nr:hypothetical protein DERF_012068 [Dermatophagoides farinae]